MSAPWLVYPMFVMVLLTFATLLRLFRARSSAARDGRVNVRYYKTYQEGSEPPEIAQLARNFSNLLEAPTLFYVACLAAIATGLDSVAPHVLAWTYVVARLAHSYVHTGSNTLNHRIAAYFLSWAVLVGLWVSVVIGVASSS